MNYAKFTKQGKLIKGIKLELVPQGNTRDAISKYKIVEADQQLADMVKEVVMAGNEFYKDFIKQIVGHMDGADWQAYGEAVENKATELMTKQLKALVLVLRMQFWTLPNCMAERKHCLQKTLLLLFYANMQKQRRTSLTIEKEY